MKVRRLTLSCRWLSSASFSVASSSMALLLLPLRSAARSPPAASRRSGSTGSRRRRGRAMVAVVAAAAAPSPTPAAAATRGHCPPPGRRRREGGRERRRSPPAAACPGPLKAQPRRRRRPRPGSVGWSAVGTRCPPGRPRPAEVKRREAAGRGEGGEKRRRGGRVCLREPRVAASAARTALRVGPGPAPPASGLPQGCGVKIVTPQPALALSGTEPGRELTVSVRPARERTQAPVALGLYEFAKVLPKE